MQFPMMNFLLTSVNGFFANIKQAAIKLFAQGFTRQNRALLDALRNNFTQKNWGWHNGFYLREMRETEQFAKMR